MDGVALGLDIGGTKVAAALLDAGGRVLGRARGAVDGTDNAAGLTSVCRVAEACLDAVPGARERLVGIGAGCPGSIDWRAGVVNGAANLGWRRFPLAGALQERYGVPVLLDNDVNVAAWGERSFGAGRGEGSDGGAGADDFVFITVGTGIGAGLIAGGRLLRGRGGAGELGHIPLLEDGPRCACGMTGCLEAVASGPALARAGQALAGAGRAPGLLARAGGRSDAVTAPLIVEAAVAGDLDAARLLDREGYYLALAVLVVGRLLDPARVVLGGGLAESGSVVFEALWDNLARLRPRGPDPRRYVVPPALGADAGAAGAAALVLVPEPGFVAARLTG